MKLPPLLKDRTVWLKEFDHWVTPYLEEIKDSEIFHKTIVNIKEAIDLLGKVNQEFSAENAESANYIVDALIMGLKNKTVDEQHSLTTSFCDLVFLISGKSDNNYKCQFPIYLKEVKKLNLYPQFKRTGYSETTSIPRVIKAEDIALLAVRIETLKNKVDQGNIENLKLVGKATRMQRELLFYYFEYILDQEIYARSLKIFGSKYFELKKTGAENDLLTPMIISYVRGSASASGGHKPESILREYMNSWGLKANEDYNKNDVKPTLINQGVKKTTKKKKTRAYDFVLPYNVKNWEWCIFIQSQFYAGDSGSVSHKNVDQTTASRAVVLKSLPRAKFVEYVDGGGYYGSLNGDLKKLLNMRNTENFFQVKSSPVKLRQILQSIGFLTPLELVHAICICDFDLPKARERLVKDGYSDNEIERVLENIEKDIVEINEDELLNINTSFYKLSRRYFLLDCLAFFGENVDRKVKGNVLVPGYGEYFGCKISYALQHVKDIGGKYYSDWTIPAVLAEDLEFLTEKQWIINT